MVVRITKRSVTQLGIGVKIFSHPSLNNAKKNPLHIITVGWVRGITET